MQSKDEQIHFLEQELLSYKKHEINHLDLRSELEAIYLEMDHFAYAKMITGTFKTKPDTVFTFLVKWNKKATEQKVPLLNENLKNYLKARFKFNQVKIINQN